MLDQLFERDIIGQIIQYLGSDNIIVLHGARQVGKTHILYYLQNHLKSQRKQTIFFDLEDSRLVELLNEGVDSLLTYVKGEGFDLEKVKSKKEKIYIFIDEIQYLQKPSPLLKLLVDHHKYFQIIVSGSSSFDIKSKFSDSLVGRTVEFEIFQLSFREFLKFKKITIDLSGKIDTFHLKKLVDLYHEYILFGGYPKIVLEDDLAKKDRYLAQIADTYIKKDIRDLAKIGNIEKFNNLLKVLASQSGQLLNIAELSKITSLAVKTIENYLFILENTYVIKLLRPFSRSPKIEISKAPKIFFYDTGLLQILWLRNLQKNVIGNMFETSIFAELVKKYGQKHIYFWRTKNHQEIDFILEFANGVVPIEVKMNSGKFKQSAMKLFTKKYHNKEYKVVSLYGKKQFDQDLYPWEL